MNCKKCNAELLDDAVFCPQCGERVDGKVRCANCGRDIPENSVFCTYCGARVDGKSVCKKCGTAFQGNFCPKCGMPVSQPAAPRPAAARKPGSHGKAMHILGITKQSVLYGALCVLFICSFFVTFSMVNTVGGLKIRTGMNSTSFDFFIAQFQEIGDYLAGLGDSGVDYYGELVAALYLNAALMAAAAAATIVICATYFGLGTVAFVKNTREGREISMSKYVVTPAILSLVLLIFIKGLMTVTLSESGNSAKVVIGAIPIVNIVLVSVALAAAAVLYIVINAKTQKAYVRNYVLNAVGLLLAFIIIATLTASVLKMSVKSASMSAPALFIGLLGAIGLTADNNKIADYMEIVPNSAVAFVLYLLIFAAAAVAMIAFAKAIINKDSARCRIFSCVFSAVAAAFSVAYLVVSVIICTQNLAGAASVGASPICALIFSVFTLAMSIVNCCILRADNGENGTYPQEPVYAAPVLADAAQQPAPAPEQPAPVQEINEMKN